MRAAVLEGIHQKFIVKEVEPASKQVDEVEIVVDYCALNHRDYWITKGQYAGLKFPIILGSDVSGTMDGRRVLINPSMDWGLNQKFQSVDFNILGLPHQGGLAGYIYSRPKLIYDIPAHLSNLEASALPLAGLTAFRALFSRAETNKEDKVFISGIGGGVALFALQFAVALGCEVFVSSSNDSKIERAIQMGARDGINYSNENWSKDFISKHGGVDVIIDGAGGKDFGRLIKICNPGARIVSYGATKGVWEDFTVQSVFWKQLNIMGSTMGSELDFKNLLKFVELYKIVPTVDKVFSLSEINEAFEYLSKGKQFGKIVIDIKN